MISFAHTFGWTGTSESTPDRSWGKVWAALKDGHREGSVIVDFAIWQGKTTSEITQEDSESWTASKGRKLT